MTSTVEMEPLLRAALDCARPGLLILDRAMRVRLVTRAAAELLGVKPPREVAVTSPQLPLYMMPLRR